MTERQRKRLFRRIERASSLRVPWYLALLSLFELLSRGRNGQLRQKCNLLVNGL